jgi:hypothetical protein
MKNRSLLRWSVALLVTLSAFSAVFAQDAPQLLVRAHLEPTGTVVAGSEVKLVVDCLTTTWFAEAPDWPVVAVPGAIVDLPDEQAENLHEVINGVPWYGVSRAYRIAPQTAGAINIAPFNITVHPGGTNASAKLTTPALKLVATVPAGAEGMSVFFPTQKLTVTQKIEPSLSDLKVGGSLTRTITQNASGTEAMLIPPVNFSDIEGLKRYPKPAAIKNIVQDRAGLVAGERTDTVTYVINQRGHFKLPPVTVEWWNTTTQKREAIVLPAVSFAASTAKERPLFDIPVDALSKGGAHRIIVIDRWQALMLSLGLIFVLAMVWAYPRLVIRYKRAKVALIAAKKRYADGDAPAWRALRSTVRKGSLQYTIPALYKWMDRSANFRHPARVNALEELGDPDLKALTHAVTAHYSDKPGIQFSWRRAMRALSKAAKRTQKIRKAQSPLPPLNKY